MLLKSICVITIVFLSARSTFQQNTHKCNVKNSSWSNANIGGNVAKSEAWPWHVALYYKNGPSVEYICGGTLISPSFVITAANCLINKQRRYELPPGNIAVRLGIYDLNDLSTQQQRDILRIHKTGDAVNDIAVLELYTPAKLNSYVHPACLGLAHNLNGLHGTAIGWAMTENNEFMTTVQSASIPVVSSTSCVGNNPNTAVRQPLDSKVLCVGCSHGNSVCAGDSGGGVFFELSGAWHLGGVVSPGVQHQSATNQQQSNTYAAFTNIAAHLPWVFEKTKLNPKAVQPPQPVSPVSPVQPTLPPPPTGTADCGPACRNYNCHVDGQRCNANVAHVTAVHLAHRDCKKFYTCKERSNVICEFDCPAGLHFNRNKNVCDWPWSAGCDPSSSGR